MIANVSKRAELYPPTEHFARLEAASDVTGQWYAVSTRSNFEHKIAQELSAKSIAHYLPGRTETRQWKDRKRDIFVPVFPGYIFTRFLDTPDRRLRILQTPGVVRFLATSGSLDVVPDHEIESVRRLLASRAPCFPHSFLPHGCWVRVRRGPLAGVEGTLLRYRNSVRLVINIHALCQSVATELDTGDVEPI